MVDFLFLITVIAGVGLANRTYMRANRRLTEGDQ